MSEVQHVQAMLDRPAPIEPEAVPVVHGAFTLYPTGLVVNGEPTFNEWAEVGHVLRVMEQGIAFLVGDWIRYGEERYKDMIYQIIHDREWSEETVRNYTWVAKSVPMENRIISKGLKHAHHQAVAALPPAEQRKWLRLAHEEHENGGEIWSVQRLKQAIKSGGDVSPTAWYVLVQVDKEYDQQYLVKEMNEKGYRAKAVTKRR